MRKRREAESRKSRVESGNPAPNPSPRAGRGRGVPLRYRISNLALAAWVLFATVVYLWLQMQRVLGMAATRP